MWREHAHVWSSMRACGHVNTHAPVAGSKTIRLVVRRQRNSGLVVQKRGGCSKPRLFWTVKELDERWGWMQRRALVLPYLKILVWNGQFLGNC